MAETLQVTVRKEQGKSQVKKLRGAGQVPGILYGHGQANVSVALSAESLAAAIRHGSRFVNLAGGVKDSAIIRELQWDTFGGSVLHVDFFRVSQDERIKLKVGVELRGTSPGAKEGGVIQHLIHEAEIECAANAIPDKLQVHVNNLNLNGHITVGEIALPQGVKLLSPGAGEIVVQCVPPIEQPDAGGAVAGDGGVEPELIRKAKEETDEEEA